MPDRFQVHISRLRPHPDNPRRDPGDLTELAASIRAQGILQPLVVTPADKPGTYVVLAGHRRLAAAKRTQLDMIPVTVRAGANALEVMLVENCQRADLGPIEKAEAMGALRNQGYSQARIAKATGLTVSTVSYFLSLLDLDQGTRDRVRDGKVQVKDAISAVRQTRRKHSGQQARPTVKLGKPHFGPDHPLAEDARVMCELSGHVAPKIGRDRNGHGYPGACGECWEAVIRKDAGAGQAVTGASLLTNGMRSRVEDYLMLRRTGHTREQSATRIGVSVRETHRWEAALDEIAGVPA